MQGLPDFEGLAMFSKVAEERSFAAAARAMGVSVATVSRAVTRLEERLGGRLFNRTSRRLSLTDFGHALADRASRIYTDAQEIEDLARETSSRPRGMIKLAAPLSFGALWVAPLLPEFLQLYPDITVDLHLADAYTDLIGEGFDAALRIASMEDSSLVARQITRMRHGICAAPAYIARHGRPQHPSDLATYPCATYLHRARREEWRFRNAQGEECSVMPAGQLRGTSIEAILPSVLAGVVLADLPEFTANQYIHDGRLEPILTDWHMQDGGLYFVTPTTRGRPAKVSALAEFFVSRLSGAEWRTPTPAREF